MGDEVRESVSVNEGESLRKKESERECAHWRKMR